MIKIGAVEEARNEVDWDVLAEDLNESVQPNETKGLCVTVSVRVSQSVRFIQREIRTTIVNLSGRRGTDS